MSSPVKRLVILGSTGSIGRQTLDVVRALPEQFRVVGLAAGLKGLEVMEKENLVQNAETVGAYFLDRLKDTMETYPFLGEARGLGLFLGVEIVKDKTSRTPDSDLAKKIKTGLMERGHLVGVTGNYSCVIRITPPLIATRNHVDQFIQSWKETLDTF